MMLQGEGGSISLPSDSSSAPITLGRKAELGVLDKRCSRHQADIEYKKGQLYLISRGKNPTVVLKGTDDGLRLSNSTNKKNQGLVHFLHTNDTLPLSEGDTVFLAPIPSQELQFRVIKRKSLEPVTAAPKKVTKTSAMQQLNSATKTSTTISTTPNSAVQTSNNNSISHRSTEFSDDEDALPVVPPKSSGASSVKANFAGKDGLLVYCDHPDDPKHADCIVEYDDQVVVIYDKYPKAEYHFLVIPRKHIKGPNVLTSSNVPTVQNMIQKASDIISKVNKSKEVPINFSVGFHAIPSMSQLHLHVISNDMNSPCMKTKKHWNSFTTPFFVDAHVLLKMLEDYGTVNFDKHKYENLLKQPLRCHLCSQNLPTIPSLKSHLLTHKHV